MTMPVERARSLRWGWEFLWELQDEANLTPGQLDTVKSIIRHYPSTDEIIQWAIDLADIEVPGFIEITGGLWLEPEDHARTLTEPQPGVPLSVNRGPTTPQERLQALVDASNFFNTELRMSGNLTPDQLNTLMYVRRHFPKNHEFQDIAKLDMHALRSQPTRRVWVG